MNFLVQQGSSDLSVFMDNALEMLQSDPTPVVFIQRLCALALLLFPLWSVGTVLANSADQRVAQLLLGEWFIDGAVDDNISGRGIVHFQPSGNASYWVEIYLNGYLIERVESTFGWKIQDRHLQIEEPADTDVDPYGLRSRARQEPIEVVSINPQRLACQTQRYGLLVFRRPQ